MDVFELRNKLIDDFQAYITSFIKIQDPDIAQFVEGQISQGLLWPDPLIQLNPSFKPGLTIDELISEEILHPGCSKIFRIQKDTPREKILRLHQHQEDAIRLAREGLNYILTTGTGSGKSLAYIIPIVDLILRSGSGSGIKAIIVYPMNALANSQLGELDKFINIGFDNNRGPMRFARFTGQETDEQRMQIRANPPDILLTNYVMLELMLTRPEDRQMIIQDAKDLKFLVLDEIHTYRGRQGADVAMLVRRLREAVNAAGLQCVGTSATLAGGGSLAKQQQEVAKVASSFFGTQFQPEAIVGETLTKVTEYEDDGQSYLDALINRCSEEDIFFPSEYSKFINDPVVAWVESTLGVTSEDQSGRLIRATPKSITGEDGAAKLLSELTGNSTEKCVQIIIRCLMKGYEIENPETKFPVFAFRLHQFISPGDTIFSTLENKSNRYLTVNNQQFKPGDRTKILLPIVFCRECGQEYYSVRLVDETIDSPRHFLPREYTDFLRTEDDQPAYLYQNESNPWPVDQDEIIDRLPDDWIEIHHDSYRVKRGRRQHLPTTVRINSEGIDTEDGDEYTLVKAPFRFCLNCGVAYSSRLQSDYTKLTGLSAGGRSTSTTILSLATIRQLQQEGYLEPKARKLLSFTDNRQDAALQAGHFNDFVETSLIRSALYRAVIEAGANGLRHDELTQRVSKILDLPTEFYASEPDVRFAAKQETDAALRDVLGYRLYRDLRRGWRVTSPNLEQCGLLSIKYLALDEVCEAVDVWQEKHPALVSASPETRNKIVTTLLDYMRRELAIQVQYLASQDQDRIRQRSYQRLCSPWAIDENEKLEVAATLYPRSRRDSDYGGNVYLSPRGGFGLYLNNQSTFDNYNKKFDLSERHQIICDLLDALRIGGIVEVVDDPKEDEDVAGYQLKAASLIWLEGDGETPFHDPIRMPRVSTGGGSTNKFFVNFYRNIFDELKGLRAREHTAQVPYEKREERENDFREAKLPIMYCSPTMELGIDISQLNVVNMRNVPPTPANYAQRSGRAGRSGQPALVFTYCAKGSPHDQYFFKRQARMVAGAVTSPRLDLANDDLIRAHIQAVWLAETGERLGTSLKDIVELSGDPPSLDLIEKIRLALENQSTVKRALRRAENIVASLQEDLNSVDWFNEDWLQQVFAQIPSRFEHACERWRDLYRAAMKQKELQDAIIRDASRTSRDRDRARVLRREAENQLELLLDSRNIMQSDFYIYRYFASEGFLPGYNFPRLPLSAYIPARRIRTDEGEYLSRPRFLAISEFGPRSIVYHEGSRYVINRVIMQVARAEEEDDALATERAKLCSSCGYLHQIRDGDGMDLCERCNEPLDGSLSSLFRMQNVSTKRRDRINSDEEERFRLGYEIRTSVRFHQDNGHIHVQKAEIESNGKSIARLSYGNAATIWRINLGWRRRKNKEQHGFVIDIEQGYWQKNDAIEDDPDDPMGRRTQRVIPYVEDRKNALLFEPVEPLAKEQMASLAAALKTAIQINFQLEDNELATEFLPTEDERHVILFFESAEGGAGVLRQISQEANVFGEVARTALEICHYDPDTGEDLKKAPNSNEECEAACYDCLMSYFNQRDHRLLDRKCIHELLVVLKDSVTKTSPVNIPRDEHFTRLQRLCQSDLERNWLDYLQENDFRLPAKAQQLIPDCSTRPDFLYEDEYVAIYVDGFHHLDDQRRNRDADQQACLEDLGYSVIRFGLFDDWPELIQQNRYLFGKG